MLFANNLYINTFHVDYHKGWDNYHINETFILKDARENGFEDVFLKIWGIDNGNTFFRNCLFYVFDKSINKFIYMSANYDTDDYKFLNFDYCVYLMPKPNNWLKGKNGEEFKTLEEWKNLSGNDKHSTFSDNRDKSYFHSQTEDDYRLLKETILSRTKYSNLIKLKHEILVVDKDFFGKKRTVITPSGAFDVY